MKLVDSNNTGQPRPITLVAAKFVAAPLSCTSRYILKLEDDGKIPGHRFGDACRRYNPAAVYRALGIEPEEALQLAAKAEELAANQPKTRRPGSGRTRKAEAQ